MEVDRTLASTEWYGDVFRLKRLQSHYRAEGWTPPFEVVGSGLFLPMSGSFRRRSNGVEQHVDRSCGFFRHHGDEVVVAHPTGEPDDGVTIEVNLEVFDSIDPGDWPSGSVVIDPAVTFQHRLLMCDLRGDHDDLQIEERVVELLEGALRDRMSIIGALPQRRAHIALAAEVKEQLRNANGSFTLTELARRVGCSPFHLSRTFRAVTGMTLSQYRMNMRINEVVHVLAQGADDLTRVAIDCGFADHSHMTRSIVARLGHTPSRLRELLRLAS